MLIFTTNAQQLGPNGLAAVAGAACEQQVGTPGERGRSGSNSAHYSQYMLITLAFKHLFSVCLLVE